MTFLDLIERKREGQALSDEAIRWAIENYVAGAVPDHQMAAFLMAVFFRGMSLEETFALTLAMRDSGERLVFPQDTRSLVDKHSTGGVGDKVSLVLAPLLACLGFRVPMISGRTLGITGGTLDKLESIPGFKPDLPAERMIKQVQSIGCVICAQTETMVPADKGLYALRNATGTIPSIPLISASILSKKLSEALSSLVLDVKFGSGAFMPTIDDARSLAETMVTLARKSNVNTRALLTNMNTPTGRAAGNWLEVAEAIECLNGKGPDDLRLLTVECAAQLLVMEGKSVDLADGRIVAGKCLNSGEPMKKFEQMIAAQGADIPAFERMLKSGPLAAHIAELPADRDGFISRCDARVVGEVVRDLGAGRVDKAAAVHPHVGLDCIKRLGDIVRRGDALCRIHAANKQDVAAALHKLPGAFTIADAPPSVETLIQAVVS